jgi:cytochrome c biogenesis protein CcmG/thiol:disulfide interchange protein DsbE
LLIQEVVAKYPGRVKFVNENFGSSPLAERFGVQRYPAVFVDDVLIARPRDFGFFGEGEKGGRYSPWVKNPQSQAKFQADLTRMIDLVLAGKKDEVSRERLDTTGQSDEITVLPNFALTDLSGHPLSQEQVAGRVVMVEFWATWCPPCRATLTWLGGLKRKYGDNVAILALAVESPEDKVRATAGSLSPEIRWAISDAKTARAFGDIVAVPTMLLFDRSGKTARALYGAPPDLHEQAEKTLDVLMK